MDLTKCAACRAAVIAYLQEVVRTGLTAKYSLFEHLDRDAARAWAREQLRELGAA